MKLSDIPAQLQSFVSKFESKFSNANDFLVRSSIVTILGSFVLIYIGLLIAPHYIGVDF